MFALIDIKYFKQEAYLMCYVWDINVLSKTQLKVFQTVTFTKWYPLSLLLFDTT